MAAGCASGVEFIPGAEQVVITRNAAAMASCTVLDNVDGLTDTNYVGDERREMKNQTAHLGGDTLLLTGEMNPPKGIAYRCKPTAASHQ